MHTVMAFYAFADWPEFATHREALVDVCTDNGVKGTILLAAEGINGTVAGPEVGVLAALEAIRGIGPFAELAPKFSQASEPPFPRLKVRLKNEIVSLGVEDLDPTDTGTHVAPQEWDDLISDPDVVLIDARNAYEIAIGKFPNAIDPGTDSFRDLPAWLATAPEIAEKPKIAMYCTGGIRCEKASALLKQQGFDEVYQLRGGILGYLEAIPEADSTWQGDCYVFDGRVSVGQDLEQGNYVACPHCNRALDEDARNEAGYRPGISCGACADSITPERMARFAERQRQIELAAARGEVHLGQKIESSQP